MSEIRHRQKGKEKDGEDKDKDKENVIDPRAAPLPLYILGCVFLFRLVNALNIRTFFQADEYYQALEPAHQYIFGYGYVTWEWREQLRSSIHPLLYAGGYKLVQLLSDDDKRLVILVPKIIGAVLATIAEINLYRFVRLYKSEPIARICLVLSLVNPFNWYFSTRAFSNSFETTLIIIAFRYWPWKGHKGNYHVSLFFAILSCIVRPTNGMMWIYLGIDYLTRHFSVKLLIYSTIELLIVLLVNTYLDYCFYGKLTFPIYNFVEFNVLKNLSIFYGTAPWHFYIFQAIPLMTTTLLPLLVVGLPKHMNDPLVRAGLLMLIGFSFIDHKEFRFIYPLQPIMMMIAASQWDSVTKLVYPFLVINIIIGYFLTQINERGAIEILHHLPTDQSVGFLTPCHSTPWQSHIHNPDISWWFLTCEPPLHLATGTLANVKAYRDESDRFYDDPDTFLTTIEWPDRIVVFSPLEPLMARYPYSECHREFNSVFHWDDRRSGDMIVYCRDEVI